MLEAENTTGAVFTTFRSGSIFDFKRLGGQSVIHTNLFLFCLPHVSGNISIGYCLDVLDSEWAEKWFSISVLPIQSNKTDNSRTN